LIATADGKKLGEINLDSPPAFDGMIAVNRRLPPTTKGGKALFFHGRQFDRSANR
jgi:hypothetical protein